jgi:hypothetical protein
MADITSVFQFEVRYNHILNFSQISRKILAPFVKIASSIKIENQNTIEERTVFNFDDENYFIIVGWDRILIKGQGDLAQYLEKNSAIETPFISIFNKIIELEEFGQVINLLLATNFIKKLDVEEEKLTQIFSEKTLSESSRNLLSSSSDVAITLEDNSENQINLSFGPYFGINDLMRRPLLPVNVDVLGEVDFNGVMVEIRNFKNSSSFSFKDFGELARRNLELKENVWRIF